MKEKKDPVSFLNMGTSSLFVIFLVLSLAIFATLALTSAKNDHDFSLQMATQKKAYYEACSRSELILAHVDTSLPVYASQCTNAQDYFDKILTSLDNEIEGLTLTGDVADDKLTLSWQVPFTDTKLLSVAIEIAWPEDIDSKSYYQIISWQTLTFDESER